MNTLAAVCALFLLMQTNAKAGVSHFNHKEMSEQDTLVSDEFNRPDLDRSLWTFINPLNDATYSMTGTQLSISVPESTSHDITEEGNFAPLMIQQVQDPQVFEVIVKYDALMTRRFQMQGAQIKQDSLNFIRFELYSDGVSLLRLAWSFDDTAHHNMGTDTVGVSSAPLYMKLRRVGDTWTQHWSRNGTSYLLGTTFTRVLRVSQVGIYGSNAGHPRPSAPAFTGLIDYFRVSRPLPRALAQFSATAIGSGTVRLNWRPLSEINNRGFEVQRARSGQALFETVPNSFTARQDTIPTDYVWVHRGVAIGTWQYRLQQIDLDGTVNYTNPVEVFVATSVADRQPRGFALHQNYPNPFNPVTSISFVVERTSHVRINIFDLLGRDVATILDGELDSGKHTVHFAGSDLPSGAYFYRMSAPGFTQIKRMMLMK